MIPETSCLFINHKYQSERLTARFTAGCQFSFGEPFGTFFERSETRPKVLPVTSHKTKINVKSDKKRARNVQGTLLRDNLRFVAFIVPWGHYSSKRQGRGIRIWKFLTIRFFSLLCVLVKDNEKPNSRSTSQRPGQSVSLRKASGVSLLLSWFLILRDHSSLDGFSPVTSVRC